MYKVNERELAAVSLLDAKKRYEYFLNKVTDWEEVWSLADVDGWALVRDDSGSEMVPVWPASAFAMACCSAEWQRYEPRAIPLQSWLDKWIPGIIADGRLIAVFPTQKNRGIVVSPADLARDLAAALEELE